MADKKIWCEGCGSYLGTIKPGSFLKRGMVFLCGNCETKRKASDMKKKLSENKVKTGFENIMEQFSKFGKP